MSPRTTVKTCPPWGARRCGAGSGTPPSAGR
jgi:hypothetical protein